MHQPDGGDLGAAEAQRLQARQPFQMLGLPEITERLRRAQEHFREFEAKSTEFLTGSPPPYETSFERHTKGGDIVDVYKFHIREDPPLAISSILSDILHNLRAALDSLVLALSESHHGDVLPSAIRRETAFPIASRIEDFEPRRIRAVAPEVVTEIERLQPYHRPDPERHRLAVLHRLSNIDKHRTLHLGYFGLQTTGWYSEGIDLIGTGPRPLEDGSELVSFRWHDPPEPGMEVNPSISIQITRRGPRPSHWRHHAL